LTGESEEADAVGHLRCEDDEHVAGHRRVFKLGVDVEGVGDVDAAEDAHACCSRICGAASDDEALCCSRRRVAYASLARELCSVGSRVREVMMQEDVASTTLKCQAR